MKAQRDKTAPFRLQSVARLSLNKQIDKITAHNLAWDVGGFR